MVKKNSIPNGWRTVIPIGHPLPGTRFIAFKVPLKGAVNQRLTPAQKFTPKDLISAIKALNVELGLIIDLTYTTRYYEVKDLPKNINYKKLYTVGLEVPDNATILQFKKWVREFLWENAENAFGEARGHQIDGCVYLKDLKTQPMRSNLGMDVWGSDEDANPPFSSMEESRDWPSNKDFHGSGKKSRLLSDQHPQNDVQITDYDHVNNGPAQRHRDFYEHQCSDSMPEKRHLRNWDFGNKRPRPRCSFFANHQYYISQEEMDFNNRVPGTRPQPFHDNRPHSDFHEPDRRDGFDFVSKVCGQRMPTVHNHQAYNNFREQFSTKDFSFANRGWRQKQQPFHNRCEYSPHGDFQDQLPVEGFNYLSTGGFQRRRPFHQHYCHYEMNLEDLEYTDEVSEHILGPLHDHSKKDLSEKTPLKKCVSRGHGGRLPPFQKFQKQMQLRNFDFNNGTRPRHMSYCHHPPSEPQEQMPSEDLDFEHEKPLQKPRCFQDHPLPININPDWYLDKNFDTDNCRSRSQRLACPEDSQRVHSLNGFTCRRLSRFTPYSLHGLPSTCVLQEDGSVVYCRGKNPRDMEEHRRSYF
ncbi:uncharacterized protein LOC134382351 isoform X2 [Cynocephalus volans]|uniref:uncharacterized protein LOC134382351 isoform X2 n=1 Tax=Cynocephalus volans TaxID=110931 RepID=UPI002FCB8971